MAAKSAPPTPASAAWVLPTTVLAAGVLVALAAVWFGWPGGVAAAVAATFSGWLTQPPTFTGPNDSQRRPTAANAVEQTAMNRYRFFTTLRWRALVPNGGWLPVTIVDVRQAGAGWWRKPPVATSWVVAVCVGLIVSAVPVDPRAEALRYLSGLYAFAVLAQITSSRRSTASLSYPSPGVRLIDLFSRRGAITGAVAAAVATACALVVAWYTPSGWGAGRVLIIAATLIGVTALASGWALRGTALGPWRELVATAQQWTPRWQLLKRDPAPTLIDHSTLGSASVDTFISPATTPASDFWSPKSREALTTAFGAGTAVDVLPTANTDSTGQEINDQVHPWRFRVVAWQTGVDLDVGDPAVEQAEVRLLVECALARACDDAKLPRVMLASLDVVSPAPDPDGEPHRLAYAATVTFPAGGSYGELQQVQGTVGSHLGCDVLVDRRGGTLYLGDLESAADEHVAKLELVMLESHWTSVWAAAIKMNMKPPVVQPTVARSARLNDGTEVHYRPFAIGKGQDMRDYLGYETGLATASASRFMTTTGFASRTPGARPGDRDLQGVVLLHSDRQVPTSPTNLAPPRDLGRGADDAQRWVLTGMVNAAFDAAKLSRPEVVEVAPLTSAQSREHIWRVRLRLYGGVTTPQVRSKIQAIAQTWGVAWIRLDESGPSDTVTIFAGAKPQTVRLANPDQDEFIVTDLDWRQAWVDAKVQNWSTGAVPRLLEAGRLEHNHKVQVLDFELPKSVSDTQARASIDKLRTSTGNAFILFRPSVRGAGAVRVLCAAEDPLPFPAFHDFDLIDASEGVPLGDGVDGEPIVFDPKRDVHVLIVGGTGTGKSLCVQTLVYGALNHAWDLVIGDPSKGAADFKFVEPYARAITRDVPQTAAMMRAVYAEVKRRKDLNSEHGVGSFRDLPDKVRPRPMMVVLDEFTSLVLPESVSRQPLDDPEFEAARLAQIEENDARAIIGSLTGRLARESRSAGVILVLATQRLTAKILDVVPGSNDLKVNLSHMLLGNSTYGDKQAALRNPDEVPPLGDVVPQGRGLWEPMSGKPQIIQTWFTRGEQAALSAELAKRREPLTEAERWDLSAYTPKASAAVGVVDEPDVEEEVIEIALDLSSDVLDLSLAELAEETPALAPVQALEPPAAGTSTLLVVDVDGVVAPAARPDLPTFHVPDHGEVSYDPQVLSELASAGVEMVWLTDHQERAAEAWNPLLGIDVSWARNDGAGHGWWKVDALARLVAERPHVRRVVWLDVHAHEQMPIEITHAEYASDLLAGVELVAPVVDAVVGLAPGDVHRALQTGTAATRTVPAPRPGVVAATALDDDADSWDMGPTSPVPGHAPAPRADKPSAATLDDWDMGE